MLNLDIVNKEDHCPVSFSYILYFFLLFLLFLI